MALTIPHSFTNGQTTDAAKMNSNFSAIDVWAEEVDAAITAAQSAIDVVEAQYGHGAFLAVATDDQTITASTYTTITVSDTGGLAFDSSSYFSSNTYTPQVAGAYQFNVNITATASTLTSTETLTVYISKNTTRTAVLTFTAGGATSGSASIVLKANGSTDAFKVEVYGDACTIDYAQFSGFCVKPD